jgi:hypothetical protein
VEGLALASEWRSRKTKRAGEVTRRLDQRISREEWFAPFRGGQEETRMLPKDYVQEKVHCPARLPFGMRGLCAGGRKRRWRRVIWGCGFAPKPLSPGGYLATQRRVGALPDASASHLRLGAFGSSRTRNTRSAKSEARCGDGCGHTPHVGHLGGGGGGLGSWCEPLDTSVEQSQRSHDSDTCLCNEPLCSMQA